MSQELNNFQIRPFDQSKDYPTVSQWWRESGVEPVEKCALSRDGFFVLESGVEVCCAWLYVNNWSDVARGMNFIESPQSGGAARAVLEHFLSEQARNIGKLFEMEYAEDPIGLPLVRQESQNPIDLAEAKMQELQEVDCPLVHRFTPGMYIRQIHMPAHSVVTSRIHKTEHPFTISKGDVTVYTEGGGRVRLKAPYTGITKPGTRRLLFNHEDTIWTTYHGTVETDVDKIVEMLTDAPDNPLLQRRIKCHSK